MLALSASIVASLVITAGEPAPDTAPETTRGSTVSIEQFEEVVESDLAGQKAWALWHEGQYADAAQLFVQAIKADPDLPHLWNGLGWSLLHTGQRDKAADAFRHCLTLDEHWLGALNGLGQLAYFQRDYEQAKAWFLKAPDAPAAQHSLVRVYLLTGEFDRAEALASNLLLGLPEDSDNASIQFQRAQLEQFQAAAKSKALPDALRQKIEPATDPKPAENNAKKAENKPIDQPEATNLLRNGGFEYGKAGWIIGSNSKRMALKLDHDIKAEGKQSLRATKTGGMPIDIIRVNCPGLKPGQKITVSAKIKTQDAGNGWMKFFAWDTDGNLLLEDIDVTRIHGTHDWRTAEKTFIVPENAKNAAIQFWMIVGGTVWIDDVKVTPDEPQVSAVD